MKRKLISLLTILVLVVSLSLTAFASILDIPRIVDRADLLTEEEEDYLEQTAEYLRSIYKMDVVILTEDSIGSSSARAHADDFYDYKGYGIGENYDGVLLLIVMDTREWYISTCGAAIHAVSDRDVDALFDAMSAPLSRGDYYEAFDAWMGALEGYYSDYRNGNGSSNSGGNSVDMTTILISIVAGLAVGGIVLLILRGMMNNRVAQRSAGEYLKDSTPHFRVQRDIFLYSHVTKTAKPKNNSSSTHVGSSGRSHGGGGGRF